ncbi:MAG: hypothetical protein ACLFTV_09680 [Desulfococcaceae bacterium]
MPKLNELKLMAKTAMKKHEYMDIFNARVLRWKAENRLVMADNIDKTIEELVGNNRVPSYLANQLFKGGIFRHSIEHGLSKAVSIGCIYIVLPKAGQCGIDRILVVDDHGTPQSPFHSKLLLDCKHQGNGRWTFENH